MSCQFNGDDAIIPGTAQIGLARITAQQLGFVSASLNYIALPTDLVIYMDAVHNVTLPDATTVPGQIFTVKMRASGACTVGTFGGNIDGSATYSLSAQYKYVTVQSDGTDYNVIANN
jgi:hypothetical protein